MVKAKWIEPEEKIYDAIRNPASWIRKSFEIFDIDEARLFITAHGVYKCFINGKAVGDYILAPGPGNYTKRVYVQEYDISEFIAPGENTIEILVGDGWYRSALGASGHRNMYGKRLSVIAWIKSGDDTIVSTDETWMASFSYSMLSNDICQGEHYDARNEHLREWHPVKVARRNLNYLKTLVYDMGVQIAEHERFEGRIINTPDGKTVIDFGQNIAGYVEMEFNAKGGSKITITHGEMLDDNGNFTIQNFQPGERHREGGINQRISYTASEGKNIYKPSFSVFGFRYALVETDIDLTEARFTAIAVYSDISCTAGFKCSDERLNRLFENAIWSLKSNMVGLPTDCPTRERAGRTADIAIFANAALYLCNCENVYKRWLAECREAQLPTGTLQSIVPMNTEITFLSILMSGSVAFGDAMVIVPYEIYKKTGDISVLRDNYHMMTKWVKYLERRARRGYVRKLLMKNPYKRYLVTTGFDYGEWHEPGVDLQTGIDIVGKSGIATAYLKRSAEMLAVISEILGHTKEAKHWIDVSKGAAEAYRREYLGSGRIGSERQKDFVRPMAFGILDKAEMRKAAEDLNELVKRNDFRFNTGMLTTPYLPYVLSDNGFTESAYALIINESAPGFIDEVNRDATTMWENMDGFGSRNHAAFGAISSWFTEGICGIRYSFSDICICPRPCRILKYANAYYDSPYGRIESGWEITGNRIKYTIRIPEGCNARINLPGREENTVSGGEYEYEVDF